MRTTTNILGINIDTISMEDALSKIKSFISGENTGKTVYTPNPEFIINTRYDTEFKDILNKGDLVIPDGIGLVYAAKILENKSINRVTGFDTVSKLLEMGSDGSISFYILAGKEGIARQAKESLSKKYPNLKILGTHNGYFKDGDVDEKKIIQEINNLKPDVLFVGLGSPRQEKWINAHKKNLNIKAALCIGGSFDIISGNLTRAPKIFQKLGLEWLHRFILEPSRYKRIFKLFKFGFIVVFTKLFGENK